MVNIYNLIKEKDRRPDLKIIDSLNINNEDLSIEETIDVLNCMTNIKESYVENTYIAAYDSYNNLLGFYLVSVGDKRSCNLYKDTVFTFLLLIGASSFILIHNHPDDKLEPSINDIVSFDNYKQTANIFSIQCNDSIIVTRNGWYCIESKAGVKYEEDEF